MKKKITVLFFVLLMLMSNCIVSFAATTELFIVSTADMHSNLFKNTSKGTIGYGNIYAIKDKAPDSIVVDCGDFLCDVSQKNSGRNESIMYAMTESEYNFVTLGESELKYTPEELRDIFNDSVSFEVLCANVKYKDEYIFKKEAIVEKSGKKIGLFGVTSELKGTSYTFDDPQSAAMECVESLSKQGVDTIVALCYSKDKMIAENIAYDNKKVTVVCEGGTHEQRYNGTLVANRALVTNTGAEGETVNITKLVYNNKTLTTFETTNYNLKKIEELYPNSNELEQRMKKDQEGITKNEEEVVGQLESELLFDNKIYYESTALGNYLCDAIKERTSADAVFVLSSEIKGGLQKEVTVEQYNNLFARSENVEVRKISGRNIYRAMEIAVNKVVTKNNKIEEEESVNEHFLQVAGLSVKYNPNNDMGKRIISVYVGNKKITWYNDKKEYLIAAPQSVFESDNQYFKDSQLIEEVGTFTDVLKECVEEGKTKISDEKRVQTTNAQKQYWWVIGLILICFVVIFIIGLIIARILMRFSD